MLFQLTCYYFEFLSCVKSFRKYHISTSINIGFGSVDALIKAKDSFSISSCADDELSIWYFDWGLSCDFYFVDHVRGGDQFFSSQVAASFGEDLVLHVKACCAWVEVVGDCSCAHLTLAETGVGIDYDWQVGEGADVFDNGVELREGSEADIGDSWAGGESSSWYVESFEAVDSCEAGNKTVVASWNHEAFGG